MRGGPSVFLNGESNHSVDKGVQFMHENNVAHRFVDRHSHASSIFFT